MSDRRNFLRGLASLPLIGGSVAILGSPTKAAVPVTQNLMDSYKAWLFYEQRMLAFEMAGHDWDLAKRIEGFIPMDNAGAGYHFNWPNPRYRMAGWETAPQPSERAAIVLSAVGCPLTEGADQG